MGSKLTLLAKKIIFGISTLMLLFLLVISVLYSSDGYEVMFGCAENWGLVFAGGVALFLLGVFSFYAEKMPTWLQNGGVLLLFSLVMSFCAWWIINSANLPQSDAKAVYDIALRAKNHDLLPIAPTGSYMSLWPFQAGLVLLEETIMRLVPDTDEMTIQWAYIPFMAISVLSAYMVVKRLFSSQRTRTIWCVLMSLCFPYYLFINNMYGEIPSIALMFFSLWMLLVYLQENHIVCLALAGIGMGGAVTVRKNSLIFMIACVLVLLTMFLAEKKKKYLLVIVILIAAAVIGGWFPRAFYERRAHNTMGEGVPAISYIAMGLQWNEGSSPGAWNGYHSDLYMDCGYNAALASEISREAVKESLSYMAGHPGYTLSFFYHKLVTQWAREDYMCLYFTLDFCGDRSPAAWDIYRGKAKDILMDVISVHQSIVFLGALCFCLAAALKKRKKGGVIMEKSDAAGMLRLVLLVTFIGGFLFSMIWESGSRYVMPYFVLLIPYAAEGFRIFFACLENKILEGKKIK